MVRSLIQQYWKMLAFMTALILILGYVTYSFVAPNGRFAGVQNDLKAINPEVDQAYTDLAGNRIELKSFAGKPLIINSWATWIPFSQSELPLLGKAAMEYGDAITIVAMNRMESGAVARSFLSTFGISEGGLVIALDPADNFYKAVGGYAMPETIFYSKDGVLVEHFRGVLTEEFLNERISALLQ